LPETARDETKQRKVLQEEFERAAAGFAERTKGRFDDMGAVEFSRVTPGASVLEVGAGTGNFLSLFSEVAGSLVAVDLTHGMLAEARRRDPAIKAAQGEGALLPLQTASFDLVTTAQALHHISRPVPVLQDMRRVMKREGALLLVDQVSTESYEQAAFMNEMEVIRDPSHAMSRPPSAMRIIVRSAGFDIVEEKLWTGTNTFSKWMWPGEFPEERIAAVRSFVERFGAETGMGFERDGDDFVFTRRRIMILARRSL
jgi:ubiquinone/menaquinone biosynthesis C-methylase UbiE